MPETTQTHEAWVRVLEGLEADLVGMLGRAGESTEWIPPGNLGMIPEDLKERARDLLGGQRELIAELERAKHAAAAQLAALRRMPATRPAGASVYLDVSG